MFCFFTLHYITIYNKKLCLAIISSQRNRMTYSQTEITVHFNFSSSHFIGRCHDVIDQPRRWLVNRLTATRVAVILTCILANRTVASSVEGTTKVTFVAYCISFKCKPTTAKLRFVARMHRLITLRRRKCHYGNAGLYMRKCRTGKWVRNRNRSKTHMRFPFRLLLWKTREQNRLGSSVRCMNSFRWLAVDCLFHFRKSNYNKRIVTDMQFIYVHNKRLTCTVSSSLEV